MRAIVMNDKVILINRHENTYTHNFPEITAGIGIKDLKEGERVIVDGEVAFLDKKTNIFDHNKITARQHTTDKRKIMRLQLLYPAVFYIFDLIEYNGTSMLNNPDYPFSKRYEILKRIVQNNEVTELLPTRTDLMAFFKEECEAGREGIMIKNINNIYINGRTDTILKAKNWHFSRVRFDKFEDNNAGVTLENKQGDRVLCAGKQAELVRATIIQSGFADCLIRHLQGKTENGRLREGTFKGIVLSEGVKNELK
jgi:ATP-dependent DNA ligase